MKRSVSAQDVKSATMHTPHAMRRVVSSSSLATDVLQTAAAAGMQLDAVPCVMFAASQSKHAANDVLPSEYALYEFPPDVLDAVKSCLSSPPEPKSIVQVEQKCIPTRHLEIMMRRRRSRSMTNTS